MPGLVQVFGYLFCFSVYLAMGITLSCVRTLTGPQERKYMLSKRFLVSAYFVLAAGCVYPMLVFFGPGYGPEALSFFLLLVSSLQTHLLAFSLLSLFRASYVTRRRVLLRLLPVGLFVLAYVACVLSDGPAYVGAFVRYPENLNRPAVIVRTLFLLYDLFLLVFYTAVFVRERRRCCRRLGGCFSDAGPLRVRWVDFIYGISPGVGFLLVAACLGQWAVSTCAVMVSVGCMYLVFAIRYINGRCAGPDPSAADFIPGGPERKTDMDPDCFLKERIEQWMIRDKPYLRQGLTVRDAASDMGIGAKTLSAYINGVLGVNFNTWINGMRIEEAKRIMLTRDPRPTLSEICDMVGLSDKASLSRLFKQHTGKTVTDWLKTYKNDAGC